MIMKKMWIINASLFTGFIIIQCVFFLKESLLLGMNPISFILNIFYNLIGFLILGVIIGILVALMPYKQKLFKEKVKKSIPILTFIIILIYYPIFCYGYFKSKSKGVELHPVIKYEDIKTPVKIDC